MNISIICPLYKAENYIKGLHLNLLKQKQVHIESINYIITKANDKTIEICRTLENCNYSIIEPKDFSHSCVREKAAFEAKGDIIVFISQDIKIMDELWLYNLTKNIINNECDAAFSRQICSYNNIEKYIREKNYPSISRIVQKKDIKDMGLLTFFFSDVASATRKDTFIKLNGYDGKDLITNEDMYFSHKLITNGGKIKYCADSIVEHSHNFTYKQLFQRYFDTGIYFDENKYFDLYNGNDSGFSLFFYILKKALEDRNLKVMLNLIPNFTSRFIGMKLGRIHSKLPNKIKMNWSSNKSYIERRIGA